MRPILLVTLFLLSIPIPAAEGQDLDAKGEAYADYAAVLSRYVEDGQVDYARWIYDAPPAWSRFLDWLENADPGSWSVDEQRAFWINAYNARVIAGVLSRYPLDSVRDVGLLGGRLRGFFGRQEHPVAAEVRSLDQIVKEILLQPPLWDPRIPWALACGSRGCPWLRSEPYGADPLDMQLEFQARTYLNGPHGHRLDPDKQKLHISGIFRRYEEEFERAAGSVREYAARYLTGAAGDASQNADFDVEYLDDDWELNDAP